MDEEEESKKGEVLDSSGSQARDGWELAERIHFFWTSTSNGVVSVASDCTDEDRHRH